MAEQSSQIAFAHTSQFHSAPAEKLAARLLQLAPANFQNGGRVYFTSAARKPPRRPSSLCGNIIWNLANRSGTA